MKKLLSLLVCLLLLISCEFVEPESDTEEPTVKIKVTYPNESVDLQVGNSYSVRWESDVSGLLKIELSLDSGNSWNTLADSVQNTGSYVWGPLPNVLTTNGLIRVSSVSNGSIKDQSDGNFNIIENAQKVLILTSPQGGEIFTLGAETKINWISSKIDNVKLEFSEDNGKTWSAIAESLPANQSSYSWGPLPSVHSEKCLVRVTDLGDNAISDVSDKNFSILVEQGTKLLVLSPNGGEEWSGGTPREIKWFSEDIAKVKIEYSANNGITWETVADNINNTGIYYWNSVPSVPSTLSKVRISNVDNPNQKDESDEVFSILSDPEITVTSPNGGENWLTGQQYEIRWTAANVENVKIEYTIDNTNWTAIEENAVSNGSYNWQVPDNIANKSELCKIRISDPANLSRNDVSDDFFAITPKVLRIEKPNSGSDIVKYNQIYEIEWYSTGIDSVRLEYTIDNGVNWLIIENAYQSVGSYSWNPPDLSSSLCRVKITDVSSDAGALPLNDQSDGTFRIQGPNEIQPITVVAPNGGEELQKDSEYKIKWTAQNIANIRIELTVDGENTWTTVANNIPNNGEYNWTTIPDVTSSLCKIKISNADASSHFDLSDDFFSISNKEVESIEVVFPNGTEEFETGTKQTIQWKAQGIEKVKIEYSTNGGNTWSEIVNDLVHSGSYEWTIPDEASTQCKVRISDADDHTPIDESDKEFTIKIKENIEILTPVADEYIIAGEDYKITWTSTGIEKVKIEATAVNGTGEEEWFSIVSETPNDNEYTYRFTVPSENYVIMISDASDGNPSAKSAKFKVKAPPEKKVTILSPNGGEKFLAGETHQIRWAASLVENVKIEYSTLGESNWKVIENSVINNGYYNWEVPEDIGHTSLLSKIRVSDVSDTVYSDQSDDWFTIYPPKYIRIHQPNGGEYVNIENHDTGFYPIMWESAGVDSVEVLLSRDNGNTWSDTLSTSTISDGVFALDFIPLGRIGLARIRIRDIADPKITDISDGYFFINIKEDK
ncbi:MAG: hypothetical protein ACEPO8_08885 [Rhodothermaceae bacterium]